MIVFDDCTYYDGTWFIFNVIVMPYKIVSDNRNYISM